MNIKILTKVEDFQFSALLLFFLFIQNSLILSGKDGTSVEMLQIENCFFYMFCF